MRITESQPNSTEQDKCNECVNKKRTFLSVTCSGKKNKNIKAKKQNMVVCYSDVPENV